MKKIIKYLVELISISVIDLIDFFLYYNRIKILSHKDETIYSLDVSEAGIEVFSHDCYHNLLMIHQCRKNYLYTVYFNDGSFISVSKEHPIMTTSMKEWKIEDNVDINLFSFMNRTIKFYDNNYFTSELSCNKPLHIKKIKRSFFKICGYDLTVDGDHTYAANNCILHNCVTYDMEIKLNGQNNKIGELYYAFSGNKVLMYIKTFLYKIKNICER